MCERQTTGQISSTRKGHFVRAPSAAEQKYISPASHRYHCEYCVPLPSKALSYDVTWAESCDRLMGVRIGIEDDVAKMNLRPKSVNDDEYSQIAA